MGVLPARQAEALRGAFAISDDPVPPDALLTGIAVLTLLSVLSDDGPLLVAVDDAQWLDRASLDALAFADPDPRITARLDIGWSLLWSEPPTPALSKVMTRRAEASASIGEAAIWTTLAQAWIREEASSPG